MDKSEIIIVDDAEKLARAGADLFCRAAAAAVARTGRFAVALSGGTTPRGMHRLLSQPSFAARVPWQRTHIFWVDERLVPFDHAASNFGAAQKDFIGSVPVPGGQVHPMPVDLAPDVGAGRYRQMLASFLGGDNASLPRFDLILLGIGMDGHTASLFPGPAIPPADVRWVLAVKGGVPDLYRLTLSYRILNRARQLAFLVSGVQKAPMVRRLVADGDRHLPAGKIAPPDGRLTWLLDREAASMLPAAVKPE